MNNKQENSRTDDASGILPFPNSCFEAGETGWTIHKDRGAVSITSDCVGSGKYALCITASEETKGARVDGPLVPCKGPGIVELFGSVCCRGGRNLGLWVRQIDAGGAVLPVESWGEMAGDGKWCCDKLMRVIPLDERTVFLRLSFIAYPKGDEKIETYVGDFKFVRPPMRIPPLPRQYKLRPTDKDKLTAADVAGPDGLVYPNWTKVGVQGGIPEVPVVLKLADAGAKPETDISALLESACRQVGAKGGGAVLIGAGTFYVDNQVTIRDSGVVVRGSGRDKTRLIFRYSLVHPDAKPPQGWPHPAVFLLRGDDMEEHEYLLAEDGKRGDCSLTLTDAGDLKAGDKVVLRAPDTTRWQALVNDRSTNAWGRRTCLYEIQSVDGITVGIGQPLRIDYPVADESCLQRMCAIERSGVEDLTVEHACRMGFYTVNSNWALNCWVRRMDVIDSGNSGVHFHSARWCEVRDCTFTGFDAAVHVAHRNWWGYAGFTQSADCLMEDTVWIRFRHGPQVQFGAQGNVIRNSVFDGSDAEWHAGWSTENLFENCIVNARSSYGSYGYGAYATGSNDTTHGPNGPRNVVYNCDFKSHRDGAMLNGINENWLFLHNRFDVEKGAGFVGTCGAFDHIIRHNTFILRDGASPLLRLKTVDCVGVELSDNTLCGGNGEIYQGLPALEVERGNRAVPHSGILPERPVADPPSIYEWQQEHRTP